MPLISSSDPVRKVASTALSEARGKKGDAARAQAARDGFDRATALAGADADIGRVAEMVRAAVDASGDLGSTTRAYEVGLRAIASGVSASGGFLAGLALHLTRAGYRTSQASNRSSMGQAAVRALAAHAPTEHVKRQATVIAEVAGSAKYFDSAIPALEKGLKHVRMGDGLIGRLAAFVAPDAFSLRALAAKAAKQGILGQQVDDRQRMVAAGLGALAATGDARAAMAKEAVDGMTFSNTSREAGLQALRTPWLDRFRKASTTADIARTAARMLGKAHAGSDRGRWVDEKTELARTALAHIAAASTDDREKALAGSLRMLLGEPLFTVSASKIAGIGFERIASGHLSDRAVARMFAEMTKKATSGETAAGRYKDDQSVVARYGAELLAQHGQTAGARTWGDMLQTALGPGKFTTSNVGLARVGFAVAARGLEPTDRNLARTAQAMVKASVNSESSSGRFQADKSMVVGTLRPWLKAHVTSADAGKLIDFWGQVTKSTTFALSDDKLAQVALDAVATGRADDRTLGALAATMTKAAHAGETAGWAYKDDKTAVALQAAEFIATHASEATSRDWAAFLQHALDRISFTRTAADSAVVVFDRIAGGHGTDEKSLAAAADALVDKALSTQTAGGRFADDKSVVAANAAVFMAGRQLTPGAATLVALTTASVGASRYATSCARAAHEGFHAIARGQTSRGDVSRVAARMIKAGTVDRYQDQTPIAAALLKSLAKGETGFDRSRLALDAAGAMMENDVDFHERVKTAEVALQRWGTADPAQPLEPAAWVRELSGVPADADARVKMVASGVRVLAADKGQKFLDEANAEISGVRTRGDRAAAYGSLLQFMDLMEKRPSEKEKVERMVEALNNGPGAQAPKVEVSDEYVVIGGVRVKKNNS